MPTQPLRPCAHPGCAVKVRKGRCAKHTQQRRHDPEQRRYYGSADWKALRAAVLREEPRCRECAVAAASVVDHIDGNYRNRARGNLQGLCARCNAIKTGRQHAAKRWGR